MNMTYARPTSSLLLATALLTGCGMAPAPAPSNNNTNSAKPVPVADPSTYAPSPAEMEEAASKRSAVIGKPAMDFRLQNQDEEYVQLSDLRGKWVILYFYPADDTPGCTCQATEFTDILSQINSLDAVVMGVSPDAPGMHRFFRAKYKIALPLLSDVKGDVMRHYGAIVDSTIGGIKATRVVRSTYLIDPQGTIAWHWPEVLPKGHASRVRDRLKSIQAAQATPDDAGQTKTGAQ